MEHDNKQRGMRMCALADQIYAISKDVDDYWTTRRLGHRLRSVANDCRTLGASLITKSLIGEASSKGVEWSKIHSEDIDNG